MRPAIISPSLLDLRMLGRHQAAAFFATCIDFCTMVTLVEVARTRPPFATLASAAIGGLANFTLSRTWTFRNCHRGSVLGQAARYALVCAGGALLNASLLGAALAIATRSYVGARAVVSLLVSALYTYPMHARFVFQTGTPSRLGGST